MIDKLVPPFEGVHDGQTLQLLEQRLAVDYPGLTDVVGGIVADYLIELDRKGDVINPKAVNRVVGVLETVIEEQTV